MLKRIVMLCVLPLMLGGAVYIFFREGGLLGLSWKVPCDPGVFGRFLISTFPDFCWSFSLANALYLFLCGLYVSLRKSFILVTAVIVFSEMIQVFFPKRFTFDFKDLLAGLLAVFLSTYYSKQALYEKKKF